jgi:hypothetical protein
MTQDAVALIDGAALKHEPEFQRAHQVRGIAGKQRRCAEQKNGEELSRLDKQHRAKSHSLSATSVLGST